MELTKRRRQADEGTRFHISPKLTVKRLEVVCNGIVGAGTCAPLTGTCQSLLFTFKGLILNSTPTYELLNTEQAPSKGQIKKLSKRFSTYVKLQDESQRFCLSRGLILPASNEIVQFKGTLRTHALNWHRRAVANVLNDRLAYFHNGEVFERKAREYAPVVSIVTNIKGFISAQFSERTVNLYLH